jgi:SAM-dependent methyltransferase
MATNEKSAGCCGGNEPEDLLPDDPEAVVKKVREKYGHIAASVSSGCCGPSGSTHDKKKAAGAIGYAPSELDSVPEDANLSLGCGAPVQHLDLKPGETVLDLGSGAGIDVFLAAEKVGPEGKAIGVDMTPEMISRARDNATKSKLSNVEFREGRLESLPVEDASVDAVTSNCVINLVPDKSKVFREVARVLKPGGRMVISDIVLDGELPESIRKDVLAYVGCVAGAMQREDYFSALKEAGLSQIDILGDVDLVAMGCDVMPDKVAEYAELAGASVEGLKGKVHSITYRAVK